MIKIYLTFKLSIVLSLLLFAGINTVAQAASQNDPQPLLSGDWIINEKKSNTSDYGPGTVWKVSILGPEMIIAKTYSRAKHIYSYELILFADNRGELNQVQAGEEKINITSKTHWKKGKLVRISKSATIPPKFEIELTENYFLSKDGKQLIYEQRMRSDLPLPTVGGLLPLRLVFDRK